MTSPHIDLYIKDEDENESKDVEHQPLKGDATKRKMSETHAVTEGYHEPGFYEIRIRGHLDDRRAAWFEGLTLKREDSGDTLLTGLVIDQAALYGLLRKVRDLGMPLISVNLLTAGRTDE
jgi:hypothetical protein